MIEEAFYSLFDNLSIGAGIYVRNLYLNAGNKVVNRPTGTNFNFFEGGI